MLYHFCTNNSWYSGCVGRVKRRKPVGWQGSFQYTSTHQVCPPCPDKEQFNVMSSCASCSNTALHFATQLIFLAHTCTWKWSADHHLLTLQYSATLSRLKKTASIKLHALTVNIWYKWWQWQCISLPYFNQMSESFREWYTVLHLTLPSLRLIRAMFKNPVTKTRRVSPVRRRVLCILRKQIQKAHKSSSGPLSLRYIVQSIE